MFGGESIKNRMFSTFAKFYSSMMHKHPIITKASTGLVFACIGDLTAQRWEHLERNMQKETLSAASASSAAAAYLAEGAAQSSNILSHAQSEEVVLSHLREKVGLNHAIVTNEKVFSSSAGGDGHLATMTQIVQGDGEGLFDWIDYRRLLAFSVFGMTWTGPCNHFWLGFLSRQIPGTSWDNVLKKLFVQNVLFTPTVYLPFFYIFNGTLLGMDPEAIMQRMRNEYVSTYIYCMAVWIPVNSILFWKVPERYQSVSMAAISLVWNTMLSYLNN